MTTGRGRFGKTGLLVLLLSLTAIDARPTAFERRAQEDDRPTERSVLLELFQATGGENWNENYGWSENLDDLCEWYGVTCDTAHLNGGRRKLQDGEGFFDDGEPVVVKLKLSDNYLVGRVPDSLWQLPRLEELDVSFNEHLEMTFSGLTVPLRWTGSNNRNLHTLRLHDTATTSVSGISTLEETLRILQVSKNRLDSQMPRELFALTKLSTLSLAECAIQGTLPTEISQLSQLHELNLFDNAMIGRLPDTMSRLVHLRKLSMSYNSFQGTIPEWFNDFKRLQQFWAVGNDFTGQLPSFSNAPDMVHLNLKHNDLSGNFPSDFLDAVRNREASDDVVTVDVRHNSMGDIVPDSLLRLHHLPMQFYLGDNKYKGFQSYDLCTNTHWNGGALKELSCSGLLCPTGQFSTTGAATREQACVPCPSLVEYLGATNCFDKDDKSVLSELYVTTGGATDWHRTDGWMQEDDVCNWYGVVCWDTDDSKQGRVRKIQLRNNNLQGKLPDTVYSMIDLTTIDISQNPNAILSFQHISESQHIYSINIGGTATQSFDGIEEAQSFFHELWADGLNIPGPIPDEIFGATSLRRLSLQDCGLSGELDGSSLLQLTLLEELYLSNNELQGNIPDVFGNGLNNLRVLALAKNAFRGPLPPSWDNAPSLESVTVHDQSTKGGGLTGNVPSFGTSTTIRQLLLGQNELDGEVPADLLASIEADTLITVDLSHNALTGTIPTDLVRFERLNIFLEGNFITDIAEQLCRQVQWMNGNVDAYGCDAILCPKGTTGGRRQYIDSGCDPCPSTAAGDGADAGATEDSNEQLFLGQPSCGNRDEDLTERDILTMFYQSCGGVGWHSSKHWLSEKSVCEWYGIACNDAGSVTSIYLANNQLVGSFPTEVFLLPNLSQLKLFSNAIYFSYDGIENAKHLRSLSLDDTGLQSMQGIGAARSLRELNVAGNALEGDVPEELSRLVHLESLSLSDNMFSGLMPYWMRSLRSLRTLSMSRNKLEGPLFDFASFEDLEYLDLSHNRLSGEIPETFLESVSTDKKIVADLAHNRLSGTVPAELGQISRLSITLADNRISAVHEDLCDVDGWNDFDVKEFGCNGILCPPGTYGLSGGRQSSSEVPCLSCRDAKYMGASTCASSASTRFSETVAGVVGTALVSIWMLL